MWLLKIFKKKQKKQKTEDDYSNIVNGKVADIRDDQTGEVTKSALEYGKQGRFLKLKDSDCAMVMHEGGKVEIIFTKLYDPENQEITLDEQTLMALAMFLKQPGFGDMIRHEFNRIATRSINQLTKEKDEK